MPLQAREGCKATVMYLFVDSGRGKATYAGAIFGSCHYEGRLGKQRLKGLRGAGVEKEWLKWTAR